MAIQLPGEQQTDPPLSDGPAVVDLPVVAPITAEPGPGIPEAVQKRYATDVPRQPNPFDQFDAEPDAGETGLLERARLNALDGYYRGDPTGAGYLRNLAEMAYQPDAPDDNPAVRENRKKAKAEYEGIVADLARYDLLAPWGSTTEAAAALGGQLYGGLTPAALLRVPLGIRFAGTAAGRITEGAVQGGLTNMAMDPAAQTLAIEAGVQKEFDPLRTALSGPLGAVIGGGMVGAGQVISSATIRRTRADLAAEDPSIKAAGDEAPQSDAPPPVAEAPTAEPKPADVTTPAPEPGKDTGIPAKTVTTPEPPPTVTATAEAASTARTTRPAKPASLPPEVPVEVFRGSGRESREGAYNQAGGQASTPILGEARYYAFDEAAAKEFGPKIETAPIGEVARNPLVITDGKQWQALTKEAGWQTPNPFGRDKATLDADIARLRERIEASGHDGVVVWWNDKTPYDIGPKGENIKLLRNVFDVPQAISFRKAATGAESDRAALKAPDDVLALAVRRGGGTLAKEQARPQAGVPSTTGTAVATVPEGASPQQGAAIRSLQQQAFDFADAIGFPLREGRVTVRNALGIYKTKSGVVRVKEVPDFEVVAHEAGHAIEGKAGKPLTALTKAHISELGPLDYDQGPGGARANEGFAEWIRRYIGNPAHAQQVAPTFTAAFRQFMQANHPDMMVALDNAAAAYQAFNNASSVKVTASRVRFSSDEFGFGAAMRKVKEIGIPQTIGTIVSHAYEKLFDQNADVARAVRELGAAIKEKTGSLVKLTASENPEVLLRHFARTQQAAVMDMRDGVRPARGVQPEGPSLTQALRVATGQESTFGGWNEPLRREFSTYLIDRRSVVLWDKFDRGDLPNPPDQVSRADAMVAIAERERANPQFRQAAQMVHDYTRQLLHKAFDGNLIGAEIYDKLLKEEFYVPFYRDLSDRPLRDGDPAGGGSLDRTADVVHRMKGSTRDIMDPIESLMLQTFLVNRAIRHNDIIISFRDLARRAGNKGGRYVEDIPAHEAKKYTFDLGAAVERKALERGMSPDEAKMMASGLIDVFGEDPLVGSFFKMEPAGKRGEPIVFYKEGGELRAARFMAGEEGLALYELVTTLPRGLQDLGLQVLSTSSGILRSGIVTNPVYALTNFIRDQIAVFLLRPDYVPFVSGWRGVLDEYRQADSAKLYGYAGGVSAGSAIAPLQQASAKDQRNFIIRMLTRRQQTAPDVDALKKTGYISNKFDSLHGFLEFVSIAEAGTRNSIFDKVYQSKRRDGLSEYEAMWEAAHAADDIMPFGRWGSRTQAIRALTPFVNSWAQGMDKAYRTTLQPLLRDPVFLADLEAVKGVPRGFLRVLNNASFALLKIAGLGGVLGVAWAALHHDDDIYQYAKAEIKGTHFVTSMGGKMLVIPKPFELSLGFTAGEFAYQRLRREDPRAAEQFAEAAFEVLMPPVPFGANPAIKTGYELRTGVSTFTKRDIVPEQLARLPVEQQYTDRTSPLAKAVGPVVGMSPIKVDYAIGSLFGLWGRDAMALSAAVDENSPAQSYEDWVFFRRFIKDPTRTSDVTTKFWDYMARTTGKYNQAVSGYDALIGRRSPEGDAQAREMLAKLPESERAYVILRSAADEDGKPAFKPDHRRMHPLQRALDAATVLNGLRKEMSDNSFKLFGDNKDIKFSPTQRRDLLDNIRELAQKEMRNGLTITKEPGYANRALLDTSVTLEKIRTISPEVAAEIATRYATAKIYKTDAVASQWPRVRAELLRAGSDADLDPMIDAAQDAGFEFGGERVKKPQKRRVPIKPTR